MTEYIIKRLSPDLLEDYFDFFDNRAFSDGSPFYPCYCNAFNMSQKRIQDELYKQAAEYGGGEEGWKRALRESAMRMVEFGEIQGYLVYDKGTAIGWCNANDRLNYYRVGEFDLSNVPQDERCDYCQNEGEIMSVVCFEISPEYRGKGIATLLLDRICKDAESDGYAYVEAYPVISESVPGLAFTGPKRLYEKTGFSIVEQREKFLVMRKKLKQTTSSLARWLSREKNFEVYREVLMKKKGKILKVIKRIVFAVVILLVGFFLVRAIGKTKLELTELFEREMLLNQR